MNLDLFINLAAELSFTVDTAADNVFEAHRGTTIVHVDGVYFWGLTNMDGIKLFRFYNSDNVEEFGLKQLRDAV